MMGTVMHSVEKDRKKKDDQKSGPTYTFPKLKQHPLRWTAYKAQNVGTSLLLGHIGVLAVIGLYYVLFETWHPITHGWHQLVPSNYWRHLIRNVGEGVFGAMLAQQVLWNSYQVKDKAANWFDRLEMKLRIPNIRKKDRLSAWQLASTPFVVAVYAIPGFLLGALAVRGIHHVFHTEHVATALQAHPSIATKLWANSWDQKVVGFVAGVFMARRPMRKVFDDVQLFFIERRLALGRIPARLFHPPAFRIRARNIDEKASRETMERRADQHGSAVRAVMIGSVLATAAFAGFGYYVMAHIATKAGG